jgi:5'-phosphate synthase pdxT subunit
MVRNINIGVLGIQGSIIEHVQSLNKISKGQKNKIKVRIVNNKEEIFNIDALIIPGGESTTVSKVLNDSGMYKNIIKRLQNNNLPIMGTCAGCVLLAKEITDNKGEIKSLNAMDISVERNAFGRQKESFEEDIEIKGFSSKYKAIFIRAPIIKNTGNNCQVLAKIDNKIVMVRQGSNLALSFHPELTTDLRIHQYFIDMI